MGDLLGDAVAIPLEVLLGAFHVLSELLAGFVDGRFGFLVSCCDYVSVLGSEFLIRKPWACSIFL